MGTPRTCKSGTPIAIVNATNPSPPHHRLLPLRRQKEPLEVQPHRQEPFNGLGIASWAPCDGTQYEPDDV